MKNPKVPYVQQSLIFVWLYMQMNVRIYIYFKT